jgi:hypothetical protein
MSPPASESVSRTGLGAGMADEFKNDKLDGSEQLALRRATSRWG